MGKEGYLMYSTWSFVIEHRFRVGHCVRTVVS